VQRVLVTTGFFDVAGMRIVAGRPFTDADDAPAVRVAIVNETLARQFFNGDAVGQQLSAGSSTLDGGPLEIVGIVRDALYRDVRAEADAMPPTLYLPALRGPASGMTQQMRDVQIQLRMPRTAAAEAQVREIIRQLDPGILITDVQSMDAIVDGTIARERLLATLAGWLGIVALVLGAIGIYGVRSYAVNRRVAEFGVRLALGATPQHVAGRVVAEGATIAWIGVVVGLIAAAVVTRLVETLLFGVTPLDLPTFAAATALFVAIAIAASYVPARRAARIDPVAALRAE
jgi:ABC-type antimicrobial peptide transport system permease subunit